MASTGSIESQNQHSASLCWYRLLVVSRVAPPSSPRGQTSEQFRSPFHRVRLSAAKPVLFGGCWRRSGVGFMVGVWSGIPGLTRVRA